MAGYTLLFDAKGRSSTHGIRADPTACLAVFLDITPHERDENQAGVGEVLESGQLILGPKTEDFEQAFASYVRARFAVSVSTGTAAL